MSKNTIILQKDHIEAYRAGCDDGYEAGEDIGIDVGFQMAIAYAKDCINDYFADNYLDKLEDGQCAHIEDMDKTCIFTIKDDLNSLLSKLKINEGKN